MYLGDSSYVPNLDVEVYHWTWCNSLFVYLNLTPRRSLVAAAAAPVVDSALDSSPVCNGQCASPSAAGGP